MNKLLLIVGPTRTLLACVRNQSDIDRSQMETILGGKVEVWEIGIAHPDMPLSGLLSGETKALCTLRPLGKKV